MNERARALVLFGPTSPVRTENEFKRISVETIARTFLLDPRYECFEIKTVLRVAQICTKNARKVKK